MAADPQRSDASAGLALSWILALLLAPLALAWCVVAALGRTLRRIRKVRS